MSVENVNPTNIVNEAETVPKVSADKSDAESKSETTAKVNEEKPAVSEELKEPEKMEDVTVVIRPWPISKMCFHNMCMFCLCDCVSVHDFKVLTFPIIFKILISQETTSTTTDESTNTTSEPEDKNDSKAAEETEKPAETEVSAKTTSSTVDAESNKATSETAAEKQESAVEVEGTVNADTVPVNESVTEESKLGKRDLDETAKTEAVEESPPKKEKETAAEVETSNEAA